MRFEVSLEDDGRGGCVPTCHDHGVSAIGSNAAVALDELRSALRYRIEYCPCHCLDPETREFEILS